MSWIWTCCETLTWIWLVVVCLNGFGYDLEYGVFEVGCVLELVCGVVICEERLCDPSAELGSVRETKFGYGYECVCGFLTGLCYENDPDDTFPPDQCSLNVSYDDGDFHFGCVGELWNGIRVDLYYGFGSCFSCVRC